MSLNKGVMMMAKKTTSGGEQNVLISAGGRKLYRHESGMGTVIEFNDGQDRKVLVLDAAYRTKAMMVGYSSTDSILPNYAGSNTNGTWYIDGSNSSTSPSVCESLVDSTLNSLWVNHIDANTSRYNTDVWLTMTGCDAATHCRSITVDGVGCDIPNFQTVQRIYCEAVNLDALDPTVAEYSSYALGDWFNSSSLTTSSEYNNSSIRIVQSSGFCISGTKNSNYGVVPILEL